MLKQKLPAGTLRNVLLVAIRGKSLMTIGLRKHDDPSREFELPDFQSSDKPRRVASSLSALGWILLVVAVFAVPLLTPDLKTGHRFYVWAVAVTAILGILFVTAGFFYRLRGDMPKS